MNKLASIFTSVAAAAIALAAAPSSASATELQVAVAAGGETSTWRSDAAAFGSLKLGVRFADLVGIYALGRLGYANVDERMLTLVELGGQLWGRLGPTRPFVRLALTHQHEETLASVKAEPGGAIFGVGDGIRHRAGGELGVGLDYVFKQTKSIGWFASGEGVFSLFPDPRGPVFYGGANVGLGFNYAL